MPAGSRRTWRITKSCWPAPPAKHPDFDWDDFLPPIRDMASYQGKLLGIPYRVTASILNYQKQLLADVGFTKPPENWAEFLAACIATTKAGAPNRYGLGIWGRQGPAMVGGFSPFLRGNGGQYFDPETWEILINDQRAVEALQYYGDLMTKYKVVVPDAITWEFDEIVAGGQTDRYAMTITLAPYGTLINDPKLSKTAGKWAWAVAPGAHSRAESSVSVGGWTFGVPSACKNKEWAFEFIQMATSKEWMRRSLERGNAPPRVSVLNQPDVQERFGWAPVLAEAMQNRDAGAARSDLADPGTATAQRHLAGAAGAADGEGGAGCGRGGLAAQPAAGGIEGLTHCPYSRAHGASHDN